MPDPVQDWIDSQIQASRLVRTDRVRWRASVTHCQDCGVKIGQERKVANEHAIRCTGCETTNEAGQ